MSMNLRERKKFVEEVREQIRNEVLPDTNDCERYPLEMMEGIRKHWRSESPSSIVSFIQCPMQWATRRYTDWPEMPPSYSTFSVVGTLFHRIAELLYTEAPKDRTPKMLDDIFKEVWKVIENPFDEQRYPGLVQDKELVEVQWLHENCTDKDAMSGWAFNDPRHLTNTMRKQVRNCIENLPLFDGDYREVPVMTTEEKLVTYMNGIRISGKTDRRLRSRKEPGKIIIDDYKTGKDPNVEADELSILDPKFIPVGMYMWMHTLIQSNLPYQESREIRWNALEESNVSGARLLYVKGDRQYSFACSEELLLTIDTLVEETISMTDMFFDEGLLPMPRLPEEGIRSDAGMCRFCPLSGICPIYEEVSFDDCLRGAIDDSQKEAEEAWEKYEEDNE